MSTDAGAADPDDVAPPDQNKSPVNTLLSQNFTDIDIHIY